jgi:hypothetical protein
LRLMRTGGPRKIAHREAASRRKGARSRWRNGSASRVGTPQYLRALERLLDLKAEDLVSRPVHVETFIPKRVMGEPNSMRQLARYVSGPANEGMIFKNDGSLDEERSFSRIDYFTALTGARVRNSVQASLGSAPVDFVAVRVPKQAFEGVLDGADQPDSDAVFLYGHSEHGALLLNRHRHGELWLRYLPVSGAVLDAHGTLHFSREEWRAEMPLRMLEGPDLQNS